VQAVFNWYVRIPQRHRGGHRNGRSGKAQAQIIDAYCEDFLDEFFWAAGAQSPALLNRLMFVIDTSCRTKKLSNEIRLVDRKPEGSPENQSNVIRLADCKPKGNA
jgi:hypothetical protein